VRLTNRRGHLFRFFPVQPVNRSGFLNYANNTGTRPSVGTCVVVVLHFAPSKICISARSPYFLSSLPQCERQTASLRLPPFSRRERQTASLLLERPMLQRSTTPFILLPFLWLSPLRTLRRRLLSPGCPTSTPTGLHRK
jgi:hypothetical protein